MLFCGWVVYSTRIMVSIRGSMRVRQGSLEGSGDLVSR